MKKKKLVLNKRLFLEKDTILQLNDASMARVAGGADTIFQCASNGCSNQDTLCMVDMPTLNVPATCIHPPQTINPNGGPCDPERSVNVCISVLK